MHHMYFKMYIYPFEKKIQNKLGGKVLLWATIVGGVAMTIYGKNSRGYKMRSTFAIQYSPLQVFDVIKHRIWVPRYRGGNCAIM